MSAKVGVFPLGPNPAMQAEIYRQRQVIKALVGALQRIRSKVNDDEFANKTYGQFWGRLHTGKCIICGEDRGEQASDLDTLFCSFHCPVCDDWTSVLDVKVKP